MRNLPNYIVYPLLVISAIAGATSGFIYEKIQSPDYTTRREQLITKVRKLNQNAKRLKDSTERLEKSSKKLMSTINEELKLMLEKVTNTTRKELSNLI